MKKKTILVAAIAVMLVAALVVGGTLAYFTDKGNATNTFTVGNVKITLDEAKVNTDGTPVRAAAQAGCGRQQDHGSRRLPSGSVALPDRRLCAGREGYARHADR